MAVMTRDDYLQALMPEDTLLQTVKQQIVELGMPSISVPPELGRLLTWLVNLSGSKRILEIGALGGYSGICLMRGTGPDATLTSLELKPEFAEVAKGNLASAGFGDRVQFIIGSALDSLQQLEDRQEKFDFFFIDADKPNYPHYLEYCVRLANPGAVIAADNCLVGDRVLNPENHDPSPSGMREFNRLLHSNERLEAVLLPVRDGFSVARVKSERRSPPSPLVR